MIFWVAVYFTISVQLTPPAWITYTAQKETGLGLNSDRPSVLMS